MSEFRLPIRCSDRIRFTNSLIILRRCCTLETDSGLTGVSVVFTVGAGTDWICYGIRDLCQLIIGTELNEFSNAPIKLYRRLIDHHQLRWLHDGVFRMAAGAIINAMFDLWAKAEGKPLWKLLVDLEPEFVADCIDYRNISDALTRDEAVELLRSRRSNVAQREQEMATLGPKAYLHRRLAGAVR